MFKKIILCCILPVIIGVSFLGQNEAIEIFGGGAITSTEIAQKAGYPAKSYDVITQDGYILRMDRVTGSEKSPPSDNKTVVLLVHGLLDASPTWLLAGPEKALGCILADEGYDVWLGNVRGNRYSRRNLNLKTSDSDFWNFSLNEMGIYDVPAMIDHIINQTNQQNIFIVTHSQGGTVFFMMASERPEYQENVIAHISLAPAVFLKRIGFSLLKVLCLLAEYTYSLTKSLGIYELEPSNKLLQTIGGIICRDGSPLQPVCLDIIDLFSGVDEKLNATLLPLITQYVPAGAAIKQLAHLGQLYLLGKFQKFDYGRAGNIVKYNEVDPPEYKLRNITTTVHLFYAANDVIADVEDVLELYDILPNAQKFLVPCDVFAHLDFVWGEDVDTLVYNEVLSIMERHRN